MPAAFADFNSKASALFDDDHHAGDHQFSHTGKVNNDASYEFAASNLGKVGSGIEYNLKVASNNLEINIDHDNNISKEINFSVKQVAGLNFFWKPSFATGALDLGSLRANYENDKIHLNVESNLGNPNSADIDMSAAPFKGHLNAINLGFKGTLSTNGLSNASWGFSGNKEGLEMAFHSHGIDKPFTGNGSIFKSVASGPFSSYGLQCNSEGMLAVAAQSNEYKFKLDNAGEFSIARKQAVNSALAMNLCASANLTNLSAGHKFGCGLSFE